jgi:hypothetical protein
MRFHSTPESALNGEITILAIIETVLSVTLYLWAGLHFGTFKYLALAVVFSSFSRSTPRFRGWRFIFGALDTAALDT